MNFLGVVSRFRDALLLIDKLKYTLINYSLKIVTKLHAPRERVQHFAYAGEPVHRKCFTATHCSPGPKTKSDKSRLGIVFSAF